MSRISGFRELRQSLAEGAKNSLCKSAEVQTKMKKQLDDAFASGAKVSKKAVGANSLRNKAGDALSRFKKWFF